jgi:AcrR family transcriptional regulator
MSVTVVPSMKELPQIRDDGAPQRADAARNRHKVLAAAERLFAERGASCVSMDAVAAAAGVGKGTLFRGFGDRAGLAEAVLSERERRFQEEFIRGPAPLGPGAPPVERLVAFCCRMLRHHAEHGELIRAAESQGARFRSAPFAVYRTHVGTLLREALPDEDTELLADLLLATLSADVTAYLRQVREMPEERMAAGWQTLVRRLLSCP